MDKIANGKVKHLAHDHHIDRKTVDIVSRGTHHITPSTFTCILLRVEHNSINHIWNEFNDVDHKERAKDERLNLDRLYKVYTRRIITTARTM